MQLSVYDSPLGALYFWFEDQQLVYASFHEEDGKRWLAKHFPQASLSLEPLAVQYQEDLDSYFQGGQVIWNWPLTLIGTDFQRQVWQEILRIPQGQFSTYKKIADTLNTRAFQAVGQAVGANPISIIVPCHRVLGTNWFGGYGGGLNLKRLLLELENVTLAPNLNA